MKENKNYRFLRRRLFLMNGFIFMLLNKIKGIFEKIK